MCGIVGVISFEKLKNIQSRRDFLTQAVYCDTLRGPHSTGVMGVPVEGSIKTEIEVHKRALAGYDFINTPKYVDFIKDLDYFKFAIAHNRYATKGAVNDANAHPFKVGNITLVHNGSLNSVYNLGVDNAYKLSDVDSEILTYAINDYGYKETLPKVTGAAALVWHNNETDTLHLYRNKERPLYFAIVKGENTALIASEHDMLIWLAWRNSLDIEDPMYVKEDTVVSFKDDVRKFSVEVVKPKKEPSNNIVPLGTKNTYSNQQVKNKPMLEVLGSMGLTIGQTVKFMYEEMIFKSHKSRHGVLKGRLMIDPYAPTVSHGIQRSEFSGKFILEGEVTNIERNTLVPCYELVLKNIKETNEPDPSYDIIQAQRDDDSPKSGTYVKGPSGKFISIEEFNKLTDKGCAQCGSNITEGEAQRVAWTADKQPICWGCQDSPAVLPYIN